MKVYRVRDKISKKYLNENLKYCTYEESLWCNDHGFIYYDLELAQKLLRNVSEYEKDYEIENYVDTGEVRIKPAYIDRFEVVEGKLIDIPKEEAIKFRIKNTVSKKYYARGKRFDNHGTVYSSKGGAEVALSKKSKSKIYQRESKAGQVLFMDKEWASCEVVGISVKNVRIVK